MSRKKKHAEHANHERWLVSYADFITLLFAFFVVMFASSQVDKRKAGKIALAVQVAFQQLGIFNASNTHMPISSTEPMPFSQVQLIENALRTTDMSRIEEGTKGTASNKPGRQTPSDVQRELETALLPEIRQHSVSIKVTKEGFVVSLREVGFFDSGSAELKPKARPAIETIAAHLKPRRLNLRIEGHTDDIPIHNASFKSNWDLSTARASTLVSMFIAQYGYDPGLLSAAGYAEYHPVASNQTEEGRGLNRRVDLVVLDPEQGFPVLSKSARPVPLPSILPAPIDLSPSSPPSASAPSHSSRGGR